MKTMAEIIDTIKSLKNVVNDAEVANLLGIKPKTLATAKTRNSIPYKELIAFCSKEGLPLNQLLTGEELIGRYKEKPLPITMMVREKTVAYESLIYVPVVSGKISAGGGLVPENNIEFRLAFKEDWIRRHGDPRNMSLIRVSGDSMEPTLYSGDIVLVDHNRNYIDPQGGIYAIVINNIIMIKRLQLYLTKRLRIISDNKKYEPLEAEPEQIIINGKVIWFGREIER